MTITNIRSWKPDHPSHLAPCEPDDPEAVRFDVHYPGAYDGKPLEFDDFIRAEHVAWALGNAFGAGKKAAMAELRAFIGAEGVK